MRTWYVVRHGETEWNVESRIQGHLDSRLTPLGRIHASSSARLLAELGVDVAFASPLGRVRETVEIIRATLPMEITFDDRLKEWSAGDWSGVLHAELPTRWPAEWVAWDADRYGTRSPGGESFVDLAVRARSFLDEVADVVGARVAVIAHGYMNLVLVGELLGLSAAERMAIDQTNDTVIRVVGGVADHFVSGEGPLPGLPRSATSSSASSSAAPAK